VIPADLPETLAARIRGLAIEAAAALGVEGLARVDFFVEQDGPGLWVNEVNTLPGFTQTSMYPILWGATGLPYGELIARLLELAQARHLRQNGR
jgi:D-alanine-D-alanine ligase